MKTEKQRAISVRVPESLARDCERLSGMGTEFRWPIFLRLRMREFVARAQNKSSGAERILANFKH
ncbi:MAG: hypothetical protein Q4C03_01845 [bacterium]|nr:hypothetical protein [bacterium]